MSVIVVQYLFVNSDLFVIECDASAAGVGGVLSVDRFGTLHPVSFFSRKTRGAELRYAAQELEGLALYSTIRHFEFYLHGRKFLVLTDHKSLKSMMKGPQRNRRILGWALKLSAFTFEIEYRRGVENSVADCLSRAWPRSEETPDIDSPRERGGDVGVVATTPT